ncbi:hypothetical protein FDI24_gp238 [Acidovorax phage ACP17]|uniref:Uncharacterized protein n=1 Tax=Acidovorax phage ACP17 TaxID=2010329 RepID=A0A218M3A9_9CAUD|nr:hypothetical protein FDI24_gp238 [Acidovorax phage ACP17]ASD50519.1 hypothetical protein [Acidovorax phage ACP17]
MYPGREEFSFLQLLYNGELKYLFDEGRYKFYTYRPGIRIDSQSGYAVDVFRHDRVMGLVKFKFAGIDDWEEEDSDILKHFGVHGLH